MKNTNENMMKPILNIINRISMYLDSNKILYFDNNTCPIFSVGLENKCRILL